MQTAATASGLILQFFRSMTTAYPQLTDRSLNAEYAFHASSGYDVSQLGEIDRIAEDAHIRD